MQESTRSQRHWLFLPKRREVMTRRFGIWPRTTKMPDPRFRIWSEGDGFWSVLDTRRDYKRVEVFKSKAMAQQEALRWNKEEK